MKEYNLIVIIRVALIEVQEAYDSLEILELAASLLLDGFSDGHGAVEEHSDLIYQGEDV